MDIRQKSRRTPTAKEKRKLAKSALNTFALQKNKTEKLPKRRNMRIDFELIRLIADFIVQGINKNIPLYKRQIEILKEMNNIILRNDTANKENIMNALIDEFYTNKNLLEENNKDLTIRDDAMKNELKIVTMYKNNYKAYKKLKDLKGLKEIRAIIKDRVYFDIRCTEILTSRKFDDINIIEFYDDFYWKEWYERKPITGQNETAYTKIHYEGQELIERYENLIESDYRDIEAMKNFVIAINEYENSKKTL